LADVKRIINFINGMSDDVTLIGVSLGGFVARYISSQCQNVERLILLNPSLNAPESLRKYEGKVMDGRLVPEGFSEAYFQMVVEKDDPDLPIYVVVSIDDDVVDPNHTLATYQNRAAMLITKGGHRLLFNENVKAFVSKALNTVFG
jgi:predicted esterase YcpF (UPF0227 family)